MFFREAIDWIAPGLRCVLIAITRVGVFPFASSRTCLTRAGVQGFPALAGFLAMRRIVPRLGPKHLRRLHGSSVTCVSYQAACGLCVGCRRTRSPSRRAPVALAVAAAAASATIFGIPLGVVLTIAAAVPATRAVLAILAAIAQGDLNAANAKLEPGSD